MSEVNAMSMILERLFLGSGLLFAALAIIMSVRPAREAGARARAQ